jgi:tRNA nucleotidyltransferase (CCA-adding enzyme)
MKKRGNLTPLINATLSKDLQGLFFLLGSWAQKNAMRVYAVGGFVRDLLLEREKRDIDLVVDSSAVEFAKSLKGIIPGKLCYSERFGTATLMLPKDIIFDMVTAGKDFYTVPGLLPVVKHSNLKNDLYKRDFTMNTMACSLNSDSFGFLHDYFGGEEDLREGLIRVLYRLSFVDDPLRIFRALRFEQRFDFLIEEETFSLLTSAIKKRLLEKVSKESLYQEVRLIFREPSPSKVLERMQELRLFKAVFPRVSFNPELKKQVGQLEHFWQNREEKGWVGEPNLTVLYLSLLFYGLPEHDIKYLCDLMRLKRRERFAVIAVSGRLSFLLSRLRLSKVTPAEISFFLKGMPTEGLTLILALGEEERIRERIFSYWEALTGQKPFLNRKGGG